jgi:aspartyl-tRNA(Asn)/glutamyl-tRNA(Gln) amidotransferase subunit A
MSELTALSIEAASAALAVGRIDVVDLLEAYLARIETMEPRLNCFIALTEKSARTAAEAAVGRARAGARLGPLDGIPVALKDNVDRAGVPTTNGFGRAAATMPAANAAVVANLRAAGAVLLGKLNMHEGALGGTTDNPHHGRTHNPWRQGCTPGGSSGGSGASVAGELAAAALGTDTMGSVRLPAAYCGVVGFMPSPGAIPREGLHMLCPELDRIGPLARSVADASLAAGAMAGLRSQPVAPAPTAFKVGLLENFRLVELQQDVADAYETALSALAALGGTFGRFDLPGYEPTLARRAGLLIVEAGGWPIHADGIRRTPDAYSPEFTSMLAYGRDADPARVARARATVRDLGLGFRALLTEVDVVAAPTAPQTAFAFDAPAPVNQADLTALANFAGAPALSLPVTLSPNGLPTALQLIAAPGRDERLLAVAAAVEAALPWAARRP